LDLTIKKAERPEELEQALAVRRAVFVIEQGVPEDLEVDEWEANAVHFLALHGKKAVGTCRLRRIGPDTVKAERVAVLAPFRKSGTGRRLMETLENCAREMKARFVVLNAQIQVVPFYEKMGYQAVGEPFDEAGILHIRMEKTL
jgi:predicted GNAT family N-acyltransferase